MTSPFVDAMDSFSMSFSEISDPLAEFTSVGSMHFDDALETPKALGSEFPLRSASAADLSAASKQLGPLGTSHTWLTQGSWQCSLHPDDLGGGLESSSSTASTSSVTSLARATNSTDMLAGRGRLSGGAESESECSEMWSATMQPSPDPAKHPSPEVPTRMRPWPPADLRTPRSAHPELMDAQIKLETPPHTPLNRDATLAHGKRASATPSDRSEAVTASPAQIPSHHTSPIHVSGSPLALRAWNEPLLPSAHQFSSLGLTPNAEPHSLGHLSGALSSFGLQPLRPGAPQPLFIDPSSTSGESSARTSIDATHWSLTPAMAATSLQSPAPISASPSSPTKCLSPSRRARATTQKAPRKAQSTPMFQIMTMTGVESTPPVPSLAASPVRQRASQKALRKHGSNKRMNASGPNSATSTPGDKAQGARLRARGSMMALRQANAMHAASKPAPRRPPVALNFVNYGIDDAEELCSAVAPSGSYKVPLRGYRDSDGEEDDEDEPGAERGNSPPPLRHAASMDVAPGAAQAPGPQPPAEIKRRRTTAVLRDFA